MKQGVGLMAAASSDKKKVMDVAKPGKSAPSATTRPLIVSHSGTIIDPTVNDDITSAPVPSEDALNGQSGITITKPRGPKVLQPLSTAKPEEGIPAEPTEPESKMPALPIETVEDVSKPAEESASVEGGATNEQETSGLAVSDEKSAEPTKEEPNEAPAEPTKDEATTEDESENSDSQEKDEASETAGDDSSGDNENAAIVDAVVDQANIGKKQKEEDKETLARKELVSKLIEEKKYFIPIKQKNATRSGRMTMVLSIVAILVALGAYAAIDMGIINPGFDVPVHLLKKKEVATSLTTPAATPVANTPAPTQPVSPQATPTTLTYDNKELGINFTYPSAWGDVAVKQETGSPSGKSASFTFSKQPMLKATMLTKDYKPAATSASSGASCFVMAEMNGDLTFESIKNSMMGTIQASGSPTTVRTLLKNTETVFAYERFETGEATATSCVGLSVAGYKKFTGQQFTGLHVVWKDPNQKTVPATDLAKYKSNPNDFLSDQNRKDILAVLDSVKSQ